MRRLRDPSPERPRPAAGALYRLLTRTARLSDGSRLSPAWRRAWAFLGRHEDWVVECQLFGSTTSLLASSVYPIYARRWPTYNLPMIELIRQVAVASGRPVNVVDVGAAMGDSALFIRASCGEEVDTIVCVEGDAVHAEFLRHNLRSDPRTVVVEAALSDGAAMASLVRNPVGTAIAVGSERIRSQRLDDALAATPLESVDVLKIDTDGFDGKVLVGSTSTLRDHQPAVIFEWDPGSYVRTGTSWLEPFEVLHEGDYRIFVWYTKYGEFSHFMIGYSPDTVRAHADFCLTTKTRHEWHYDVVALPAASQVALGPLADMVWSRMNKARP